MSMFQTPPRAMKTRALNTKNETLTNAEVSLEVKSDIQFDKNVIVHQRKKVMSDSAFACTAKQDGGVASTKKSTASASSTAARQKRLEFETAQAKAKIQLQEAEAKAKAQVAKMKARLDKELLEKKLAADLADLEENSRCSKRSLSISYKSKVKNWLEKSVEAPGPSLDRSCNLDSNTNAIRHGTAADMNKLPAIESLVTAIKDAVVSATTSKANNQELLSRLATSKDLPLYFGDPLEWLQFKEAFYESTQLCSYSETENLWRLRKCLRGEAKEATSSLLMSATSPQEVMETLELKFGRPEIIMRKITTQLKKIQPLPHAYYTEIVNFAIKIKNCATATRSLKQLDYLRSPDLVNIVVSKLPTALIVKWADYQYENQDDKTKLELLSTFLYEEAQKVAASGVSFTYKQDEFRKRVETTQKFKRSQSVLMCTNDNRAPLKCNFCRRDNHVLIDCNKFKRAMRKDRWRFVRAQKLCYKCLGERHDDASTCSAESCDVEACGGPHHRLLHWMRPPALRHAPSAPVPVAQQHENFVDETVAHAIVSQCSVLSVPKIPEKLCVPKVMLKIVPVTIHGPRASVSTYALLDDGATVSLISADIADKAGLNGKTVTMRATSAWDSGELICNTQIVNFNLSNSDGKTFSVVARKLQQLNLPVQFMYKVNLNNNSDLFSYNLCTSSDIKPKLLLGQDNYDLIAPIICKKYMPGGPFITQTLLGWCVHGVLKQVVNQRASSCNGRWASDGHAATLNKTGKVCQSHPSSASANTTSLNSIAACTDDSSNQPVCTSVINAVGTHSSDSDLLIQNTDADLHALMRGFLSLESIGICSPPRQSSEECRALQILDESAELVNGQWTVGLPWKPDLPAMPDSYPIALKRLNSTERKMSADTGYESRYRERIEHLFNNNYARKLSDTECSDTSIRRVWYLPHFGVDNPNKNKLRLVFDASAKCNNLSLNDFLLQGPDLLKSLYGIMFRFRENCIGIIGDIKDMFLRIKINKQDQNVLRFLWKEKGCDVVNKYAMTSLIFGANCSPFIAQFINQTKNASRFQSEMPEAVHAIKYNQYMDDYIDSFSDKNKARKILKEIHYIHKQGGFEMRNWLSNLPTILCDIPKEYLNDKAIRFDIDKQAERALGLLWFPSTDMLAFDLSLKRIPQDIILFKRIPTKRELLRIVMSIFDIHGYLGPFTITGKILMRETWKINLKWDDQLNDDLYNLFKNWIIQFNEINNIRIPRWYFRVGSSTDSDGEVNSQLELHVFCDASPSAYAAVAYWRREMSDGHVTIAFIASKCKVAPTKPVSVPRLELQGAVLACKLANSIKSEHRLIPKSIFYWTDATTVLYWIKNHSRTYKVFIANRLGEIDELSSASQWHYVPTDMNVADLGTRNTNHALRSDSEWFTGPSFLCQPRSCWPQHPEIKNISNEILEKVNNINIKSADLPVPEPSRFSSWLRLLRTTATMLLFIEKCRKNSIHSINTLMSKAENLLIRYSQAQSFQNEINLLKSKKEINRDSRLRSLTPILDDKDVLRVGSRIGNVKDVDLCTKYPIILDGKNYIARLIVMHYHVSAAHSCNETVINDLRQKYWLIRLRPTVRSIANQCLVCRFRKAVPGPPRLGDLPDCRLTHHQRPFTMCGVDLFGPMQVAVGRQRHQRYGVLFTCLTVRAVHIEVVSSLSADSLIMALRRMAARRGWPHTLFSDNGTNMRGAESELKRAYEEVLRNRQYLESEAINKGVEWKFIPPVSPHMGGAWERLIRSVKTALKVVLKERAPKDETLLTLLCEVENMINGRPLTHVSVDPRDLEALTPNHFLIGSSSNLPQPGIFDDGDLYLRKQWRIAQRLADLFWSRWMKEVLPTLAPRNKWNREGTQLQTGDLVVIVDPSSPRNFWPKGIIQEVYPGSDGRVRVVDIRTQNGIKKRPASRVALLLRGECRDNDTEGEDVGDGSTWHNNGLL